MGSTILSQLETMPSTAKWAYALLLKNIKATTPVRAQVKWQKELGISLHDKNVWENVFTSLYKITDDFKLKWLQMRILHRILPTGRLLQLYGITETDKCAFCEDQVDTIRHLFWHCRKVNAFWRDMTASLMPSQSLSLMQVLMNVNPSGEDDSMCLLIILLGKQYIWSCRNLGNRLSVDDFKRAVKSYYDVELFIARVNDKERCITEKWRQVLLKL